MTPRSKDQFGRMREQSRRAIMDAALKLFSRCGYHGASIGNIAREAGVSTGLMYHYFDGKDALLEAVVREGMERITVLLRDYPSSDDPAEVLRRVVETSFDATVRDMTFWALYFHVISQPDLPENVRRIFSDFIRTMFDNMIRLLRGAGIRDAEVEVYLLGALIDGALLHYLLIGDAYPLEKVKNKIIDKYCKNQT